MAAFRMEIWFNYATGSIDWGVATDTSSATPPFSAGGAAIPRNGNKVSVTGAGNTSTMDIYVFDITADGVSRDLQWIQVDFENKSGNNSGGGRDPVSSAPNLRTGMTGASFMGGTFGANGTTQGVGTEDDIFSAPAGMVAQRRWSLSAGFTQLTKGDYEFDIAMVVTPHGVDAKAFSTDPEMDIEN